MYKEADLTGKIIGIAIKIHNEIGPGFPEKIYHKAMVNTLTKNGHIVESEKEYKVIYNTESVGLFRLDLVVDQKIVVELKAVAGEMPKIFQAQTISYLKASGLEIALLINFGHTNLETKRLARYKNYKSV